MMDRDVELRHNRHAAIMSKGELFERKLGNCPAERPTLSAWRHSRTMTAADRNAWVAAGFNESNRNQARPPEEDRGAPDQEGNEPPGDSAPDGKHF